MSDNMTTPDGITVAIGQLWRNCDRRGYGAIRTIGALDPVVGRVQWAEKPRAWVRVDRMYRHSTGWQLVTKPLAAQPVVETKAQPVALDPIVGTI
jgi:hypothetical protein